MSRAPKAFVAVSGLAVLGATLAVAGIAVHEPGAIAAAPASHPGPSFESETGACMR